MRKLVLLLLFAVSSVQAVELRYAEDVEKDFRSGKAIYSLNEESDPIFELYYDFENQKPAECELSTAVTVKVKDFKMVQQKYLVWNQRLINYPGSFLDPYFIDGKFSKPILENQLPSRDLGKLMLMFASINIEAMHEDLIHRKTEKELAIAKLTDGDHREKNKLQKELEQIRSEWILVHVLFDKYMKSITGYSDEMNLAEFINQKTAYGEDMWDWVTHPESIFEDDPTIVKVAMDIFNTMFEKTSTTELTDHRINVELLENSGEFFEFDKLPCATQILDYWVYVPSKEKLKYGQTSPFISSNN